MIIDLQKFLTEERQYWNELEAMLDKRDRDSFYKMDLEQIKRFHYLYQRASADLAKVMTFATFRSREGPLDWTASGLAGFL